MSAKIIQFNRDPKHCHGPDKCQIIAFRSATRPDDLVMDHVDISACDRDQLNPSGTQTTNG